MPEEGVEVVLRAPEFVGGKLDWYHLDVDRSPGIADFSTPDDPVDAQVQTRYATPLRYAGMPADRLWQFEDSAVNLGGLESEPHDLARLLLVEYALSYGNDWLVVPVEVPAGSLTTIGWLTYTNTFGERFLVERPRARRPNDGWRMFTVAAVDEVGDDLPALLIPPAVVGHDDGQAIEEVLFLRDETANLAWAVERTVWAPSGDVRARSDEGTQPPPPIPGDTNAELDYRLQLGVPRAVDPAPAADHRLSRDRAGPGPDASSRRQPGAAGRSAAQRAGHQPDRGRGDPAGGRTRAPGARSRPDP